MTILNAELSPKFGRLFKQVDGLLRTYIEQPSVPLRNHIAARLYPYYESVCRWFKYQTVRAHERLFTFADATQECYLAVVRAIELCRDKDNPLAYVLAWIKGTARTYLSGRKASDEPLPELTDYLTLKLGLFCSGLTVEDDAPLALILGEIGQLSETIQSYIHLVWVRGHAPIDVARQVGVTNSAVCTGLRTARKKLQQRLKHHDFIQDFVRLPDERDRAWQLRMQGIERRIIAERLGVGENSLGGWFERDKKTRSERRSFEKSYLCIRADGTEFKTDNLTQFSIAQGLKPSAMASVANNKQAHCQGWRVRKLHG